MSENKIEKHSSSDGAAVTLSLKGDLGIEDAAELHQTLAAAFAEAPEIALQAEEMTRVDLTILQILCSACKSAAKRKITFRLAGELPDCIKEFKAGIGITISHNCRQNNNEPCVWFGGVN